jgi:pimeloyl-ACP methyl ester carboxylesterase
VGAQDLHVVLNLMKGTRMVVLIFSSTLQWFAPNFLYFFSFFVHHHRLFQEFISGLKLTSFVLMGHSLGGYLTGRFLKKYPDSGAVLLID